MRSHAYSLLKSIFRTAVSRRLVDRVPRRRRGRHRSRHSQGHHPAHRRPGPGTRRRHAPTPPAPGAAGRVVRPAVRRTHRPSPARHRRRRGNHHRAASSRHRRRSPDDHHTEVSSGPTDRLPATPPDRGRPRSPGRLHRSGRRRAGVPRKRRPAPHPRTGVRTHTQIRQTHRQEEASRATASTRPATRSDAPTSGSTTCATSPPPWRRSAGRPPRS